MDIIRPSYEIINPETPEQGLAMLQLMERAGRTCYKSEDKITPESAPKFVAMLRDRQHEAMVEFGFIVVKIVCDRGITHELVRHRICSFAQESTRWCDYGGKGIKVVLPGDIREDYEAGTERGLKAYEIWLRAMEQDQVNYDELRDLGYKPETARSVLPTCLKTEIVIGANTREWRHIFKMRTPVTAHPDMRRLMHPLLADIQALVPVLYDDITIKG